MKDNTVVAKEYTEWLVKTGGYARDMTMRDHFAGQAMLGMLEISTAHEAVAMYAYKMADAMIKERNK